VSILVTGVTCGAGTAYHSGAPEFFPVVSGLCVTLSFALCVWFLDRCLSFCPFPLAIVNMLTTNGH
jgi:hypothetical protein